MLFIVVEDERGKMKQVPIVDWPEDHGPTDMVAKVCLEGASVELRRRTIDMLFYAGYSFKEISREEMQKLAAVHLTEGASDE